MTSIHSSGPDPDLCLVCLLLSQIEPPAWPRLQDLGRLMEDGVSVSVSREILNISNKRTITIVTRLATLETRIATATST